ncbi:uncharacterized protein Z518_05519 [Rhinocladiella mackenziei CBS 650.93]|uniref:Uncharacterized protein n=1 Tax=Rhinocladiella mackenziei CBS 650.93 TaxID=1442369 RepID=A0A0D2IFQ8_9EURO|nr:uncharacterized protein Z518_05519 [Rhinocladiella mackenziei CBS 650.93]KIX04649.1 hypothetical protein Z518_05519 [Rhinocladiella mackenziei CBS 650.93]
MPASKYARLNPFGGSQLTSGPIVEEPLQFSNVIPDPPYTPVAFHQISDDSLDSLAKQQRTKPNGRSDPNAGTENLDYTGFDGNISSRPPKRRRTSSSLYKVASSVWASTRDFAVSHFKVPSVAAPWEHELSEKQGAAAPPSSSARYFDYRRQRRRLFVNSSFQFLVTAIICAGLAGCLYGFSTMVTGLSPNIKHLFNALITGLSLCLGLNLASSLKGYAQLMRWRFLASGYRTLQDFELVMNCDSQSNVFRLIWAGRTRGRWYPNKTQILAFTWLLISVALQIFTALLGLTYSIDVSSEFVRLAYGNVSVSDVRYIGNEETYGMYSDDPSGADSIHAQQAVANQWGITGQDYNVYTTTFDEYFANQQSVYTNEEESLYWYRFIDRSPVNYAQSTASYRTVNATAKCQSFEVTYGGQGGFQTNDTDLMWIVTWIDADGNENNWYVDDVATGATTWMANMTSDCGDRCVQLYALQSADNITDDVPIPRFWECQSNVSHVDGLDYYYNPDQYEIPDLQAFILAGSIGWSGVTTEGGDTVDSALQMVRYPVDSQWSPPGSITEDGMAQLVMKFTAGAISALDENGPRLDVMGYAPVPAQIIKVKWPYAAAILGGIPTAQALVLLCVIAFANKAVIKDTSHLSTARLLRPIVEKLGDSGCLLTGDEIAEQLGNYRVIYGVRDPGVGNIPAVGAGDDGRIRHLDILEEAEGLGYRRGRMPVGRYDGLCPEAAKEEEKIGLLSAEDFSEEDDRADRSRAANRSRKRKERRMSI